MKTAKDYPVTFAYGGQDGVFYGPNGSIGLYHRGNDRACPNGTPIVIGDTTIGKTNNTGASSGPHLHTQAGTDIGCQQTFDPTSLEFQPGTVVAVQPRDVGSWGKHITIKVGSKYITYAHLQSVSVKNGQVIKKGKSIVIETSPPVFNARYYLNKNPDVNKKYTVPTAVKHWLEFGINEGRASAPNFHVKEYMANYADLRRVYGAKGYRKAILHYYNAGINEGRSGRTIKKTPVQQVTYTAQGVVDYLKGKLGAK